MNQESLASPDLSKRVVSLDVFRGFIMLTMLMGTLGLKDLSYLPIVGFVYNQLNHAS